MLTKQIVEKSVIEIISPVSNSENIRALLDAGADAVYAGLKNRTWYNNAVEFSWEELILLAGIIHEKHKKLYIALNRNLSTQDIEETMQYAALLADKTFDAVILSDWGCIDALRNYSDKIEIHLSANALCIDYSTFDLAAELGIQRIIFSPSFKIEEMQNVIKRYYKFEWESIVCGSKCYNEVGACQCYVNNGNTHHKEICRKKHYLCRNEEKLSAKPDSWGFPFLNAREVLTHYNLGINNWKIEGRDRNLAYLLNGIKDLKRTKDIMMQRISN